jgi:hypothetical protein
MNLPISLTIEVSEDLHRSLRGFLDTRLDWDQDKAMTAALSLFLTQQAVDSTASRVYMNTMFSEVANAA